MTGVDDPWPGVCDRFEFPIVPIVTREGEAS